MRLERFSITGDGGGGLIFRVCKGCGLGLGSYVSIAAPVVHAWVGQGQLSLGAGGGFGIDFSQDTLPSRAVPLLLCCFQQ